MTDVNDDPHLPKKVTNCRYAEAEANAIVEVEAVRRCKAEKKSPSPVKHQRCCLIFSLIIMV